MVMQRRADGQTEEEFAEILHDLQVIVPVCRLGDGADRQDMGEL
ncbi:hypothetical protein A2U01_0093967, partial [Trifolium medium]|nr:hypothetical protein [Trifolium medium]